MSLRSSFVGILLLATAASAGIALTALRAEDAGTGVAAARSGGPPSGTSCIPPVSGAQPEAFVGEVSWEVASVPELAGMASTIQGVLKRTLTTIPSPVGPVTTFRPGALYNEVYARDLLTASKMARYLVNERVLGGGLEALLSQQMTRPLAPATVSSERYPGVGSLPGFIATDGSAGKTTAVSDEETSVLQLAHLYYQTTGRREWLTCSLAGQRVIDRLNQAATSLMDGRSDPATGLIKRAHTTDWGDVRFQGGARPTVSTADETWTASTFDQAWAHLAFQQLSALNRAAGQEPEAAYWAAIAARLRQQSTLVLWQQGRGQYRVHHHLTPLQHPFDEDEMVAVGNAVAAYAGLANPSQVRHLFNALEVARIQAKSRKPGVSVFPMYPLGFFQHPTMYQPGSYQNGGQWDWWAGVQITAEFEHGYSDLAWKHLIAIAQDWAKHPDAIAEWQIAHTGELAGSGDYAGAAGTVGEAVVRGAFGVSLSAQALDLRPRLGDRSGFLQVTLPSAGEWLWLQATAQPQHLSLVYDTNHPHPATLALLLPKGATAATEVLLDGSPAPAALSTMGEDTYVDFGTVAPGRHAVSVRWK